MEEVSSIMHWYAFKVFYNKVFEIEDSLNRDKIETYIPCERILVERGGVKKYVRKPIISSLLFFYSTEKQALALQQKLTDRVLLYTRLVNWQKLPIAIPEREMKIFMLVTSSGEKGLDYFATSPWSTAPVNGCLLRTVHSREQKAVYTASKEIVA